LSTVATTPVKELDAKSSRKSIILVFACTIVGTLAQLLMKSGMEHFRLDPVALITNVPLIAGYALYGINTVMLVMALREGELSVLYPIIALTYVWVTLASYIRLHEAPNLYKNIGVVAIIIGVVIIGRAGKK
jgi:multidrug transporter EmrE-like cation transporter